YLLLRDSFRCLLGLATLIASQVNRSYGIQIRLAKSNSIVLKCRGLQQLSIHSRGCTLICVPVHIVASQILFAVWHPGQIYRWFRYQPRENRLQAARRCRRKSIVCNNRNVRRICTFPLALPRPCPPQCNGRNPVLVRFFPLDAVVGQWQYLLSRLYLANDHWLGS